MKTIFTLILILSSFTTHLWAQATPNPGFEGWTHVNAFPTDYDTPNSWDNANPTTAITGTFTCYQASGADVNSGSSAIKLITKNVFSQLAPGIATTGTINTSTQEVEGGIPYTLRPDSIAGYFKFTPVGNDYAWVDFALLGSGGNTDTIAHAHFNTPATTVSAYTRFSKEIVYASANPVVKSVWILLSSQDGTNGNVGSTFYVDDLELIINPVIADVSIAQTTGTNPICAGESVTFTASPTNGGATPAYQWQVDGVNVGTDSPTYTTTALTDGQVVTCIMNSNLPGVTGSPAMSNAITMTVNPVPATPAPGSNTPVCEGATLNLTTATVSGATYNWSGPNAYSSTTQNPTLSTATTAMTGTYSVTVTVNGCTGAAGTTAVVVDATVTPAVTIAITSGGNPTCNGQSMTYTATPANGGSSPVYQWMLNGSNVGTNSSTYSNGTIVDGDVITCTLTSNAACLSTATATSNAITMSVTSTVTPAVAVSISSGSNPACVGQNVTFTAAPTNGGSAPAYQWQVDGVNAGTDSSDYTTGSLSDGQVITCIMTSNSGCASPSTAFSDTIIMGIMQPVVPAVAIAITSGTNPACAGESVEFTATPTNGGTSPGYQWQVDGAAAGTDNAIFSSDSLSDGQEVTCILTNNSGCANPVSATSSGITMSVTTVTTPTIAESGAVLTSSAVTGNQWYLDGIAIAGATGQTHTAIADGDYTVVVTENGCESAPSAPVSVTLTGMGSLDAGSLFRVYPNPGGGVFTISFNAATGSTYDLQVINLLGQPVYRTALEDLSGVSSRQLDVSHLTPGMYVLTVTGPDKEPKTSRLFIRK